MLPLPDTATPLLCTSLATSAFAAAFLVLWAGRRDETHRPRWAAGAAAYAVILAGFAASTHHAVKALLFASLGATSTPILAGVRLFEERRGVPAWAA